jgi:hypothetical protein
MSIVKPHSEQFLVEFVQLGIFETFVVALDSTEINRRLHCAELFVQEHLFPFVLPWGDIERIETVEFYEHDSSVIFCIVTDDNVDCSDKCCEHFGERFECRFVSDHFVGDTVDIRRLFWYRNARVEIEIIHRFLQNGSVFLIFTQYISELQQVGLCFEWSVFVLLKKPCRLGIEEEDFFWHSGELFDFNGVFLLEDIFRGVSCVFHWF